MHTAAHLRTLINQYPKQVTSYANIWIQASASLDPAELRRIGDLSDMSAHAPQQPLSANLNNSSSSQSPAAQTHLRTRSLTASDTTSTSSHAHVSPQSTLQQPSASQPAIRLSSTLLGSQSGVSTLLAQSGASMAQSGTSLSQSGVSMSLSGNYYLHPTSASPSGSRVSPASSSGSSTPLTRPNAGKEHKV